MMPLPHEILLLEHYHFARARNLLHAKFGTHLQFVPLVCAVCVHYLSLEFVFSQMLLWMVS